MNLGRNFGRLSFFGAVLSNLGSWAKLAGKRNRTGKLTMATDKDIALVNFLLSETEKGNVRWEATARLDEFTTSLRGKYNITV